MPEEEEGEWILAVGRKGKGKGKGDKGKGKGKGYWKESGKGKGADTECYICGKRGHKAFQCPSQQRARELLAAQGNAAASDIAHASDHLLQRAFAYVAYADGSGDHTGNGPPPDFRTGG